MNTQKTQPAYLRSVLEAQLLNTKEWVTHFRLITKWPNWVIVFLFLRLQFWCLSSCQISLNIARYLYMETSIDYIQWFTWTKPTEDFTMQHITAVSTHYIASFCLHWDTVHCAVVILWGLPESKVLLIPKLRYRLSWVLHNVKQELLTRVMMMIEHCTQLKTSLHLSVQPNIITFIRGTPVGASEPSVPCPIESACKIQIDQYIQNLVRIPFSRPS